MAESKSLWRKLAFRAGLAENTKLTKNSAFSAFSAVNKNPVKSVKSVANFQSKVQRPKR